MRSAPHSRVILVWLLASSALPATALAQQPTAAPPSASAAVPLLGAPPAPPQVDRGLGRDNAPAADPMLVPVPPAANNIATWGDAVGMLRARSTELKIALDEVDRASGLWRQALAGSLPTMNLSGNVTANLLRGEQTSVDLTTRQIVTTTVPDAVTYGAGVTLTQPLLAPRAWYAAGTARQGIDNAKLAVEDAKRILALGVASAIVAVVTAERVSELDRIGLRAALERQTLTRRRALLGAATALDVVRTEQDTEVARAAIVASDESLRQTRDALGLALGIAEPWGVSPNVDLRALEANARSSCSRTGVDDRADVAAARGAVEVARRNVEDVKLQFSPTVNLVSAFNLASTRFVNGTHDNWTVAGVLSFPIWDGGIKYGALTDTRGQLDESGQRLQALRRTATVQATQSERAVEVARQSREVAQRTRDLARETARLARFAFEAGSGTSLDLVESGRRLRESESQLALREFDWVRAKIAALLTVSRCSW